MPSTATPKQTSSLDPTSAAHEPFSWIHPAAKDSPRADFVALANDVCMGLNTCLEIIYSSQLDRSHNANADPGQEVLPAVTYLDSENLFRLSIAASRLFAERAERELQRINEHAVMQTQAMKGGAK